MDWMFQEKLNKCQKITEEFVKINSSLSETVMH